MQGSRGGISRGLSAVQVSHRRWIRRGNNGGTGSGRIRHSAGGILCRLGYQQRGDYSAARQQCIGISAVKQYSRLVFRVTRQLGGVVLRSPA